MFTKRLLLGVVVVMLTLVVGLGIAYAQGTTGEPTPAGEQSLLEILWESSYIGAVIGILSFVMLGLVIEHFTSIKDTVIVGVEIDGPTGKAALADPL